VELGIQTVYLVVGGRRFQQLIALQEVTLRLLPVQVVEVGVVLKAGVVAVVAEEMQGLAEMPEALAVLEIVAQRQHHLQ
jgi:hypothetical protein